MSNFLFSIEITQFPGVSGNPLLDVRVLFLTMDQVKMQKKTKKIPLLFCFNAMVAFILLNIIKNICIFKTCHMETMLNI